MPQFGAFTHCLVALCCGFYFEFIAVSAGGETQDSSDEFTTRFWQKEGGLPDNSIQTIFQSRDGYLWIGTAHGLARFDGVKFTSWDRLNTPVFDQNDVRCITEDAAGGLWIGVKEGVFKRNGGRFTRIIDPESQLEKSISMLCPRKAGGVWIGAREGVFYAVDGVFRRAGNLQLSDTGNVRALSEDLSGTLWLGTSSGVWRYDPSDGSLQHAAPDIADLSMPVLDIKAAVDGSLWVLVYPSPNSPGWIYRLQNKQWERISEALPFDPRSLFLCPARTGDLWCSSHGGSMERLRGGRFSRFALSSGPVKHYPQCAYEDREGNLWIGTERAGLHRWQPHRVASYTTEDGLAHDKAWAVCEARDGGGWIGTEGGLSCYRDGRFTNYTTREGLPHNLVRALAEDAKGRMWIGTGTGLACLEGGNLRRHQFQGDWFKSKIRTVICDRLNALWVGSAKGLHRAKLLSAKDREETADPVHAFDPETVVTYWETDGLPHADISTLLEDHSGAVWIGTSGGLCRMDGGRITNFTNLTGSVRGNVGCLYEDADGALWIAAERLLQRHQHGQFTTYTTREGLFDDVINSILEDHLGRLWFGGDRGIHRIEKAQLNSVASGLAKSVQPVSYTEANGLPVHETNGQKSQPSAWKMRDGKLWFPTTKGVLVIDPQHLPDNTNPPPVVIEQVRANGQIVLGDDQSLDVHPLQLRPDAQTGLPKLQLPPGSAQVLEIQYTANTFIAPEEARFKYRLEGQDADWIEAGRRRSAYYTNLRPGDYRFRVLAANSHGVWNETGADLAFYIAPRFHETLAFKLSCVLAALLLSLGAYRWRMSELRKVQRLEQHAALAEERSRIAKDLHDGLGANLTHLTLLADLAEQEPSDALTRRMRDLAATSREATRSLKDFLWTTQPADETLEGLVTRICQHAEEFLRASKIACRFVLPEELPPHSLSASVRLNLFLTAKEAINNLVKYSAATEARITVTVENGAFTLAIEDNGRGFDTRLARDRGRGLRNMASRVREAGGQFTLDSEPGRGTTIRIQIPLKPENA